MFPLKNLAWKGLIKKLPQNCSPLHNLFITITSHEHHCIPDHQQLNCFRQTTKKTWKVHITAPLWMEVAGDCGFPSQRANNAVGVTMPLCHHVYSIVAQRYLFVQGLGSKCRHPYYQARRLFRASSLYLMQWLYQLFWCWRWNIPALGSIPCLLMLWLLKSTEHQQAWYRLCRTDNMYGCSRPYFIYSGQDKSNIQLQMLLYVL